MSQTTKKELASSLKKLLKQKPLEKITVMDITEDCDFNRQTFYYHYKDIYDLVEWIYASEATKALGGNKTADTWERGFLSLFEYVLENKSFVKSTYHSVNKEHLERYLHHESYNLLSGVLEEFAEGMSVKEEDKVFIASFYKFAFAGLLLDWIDKGMKEEPKIIMEKLGILLQGNFMNALKKYEKKA